MSILSVAKYITVWRGYEYFESKKVLSWKKINDTVFEGEVAGSCPQPYHVIIDTSHPKKSVCDCPHAEGTRIVCKHKIALFFTVFPEEAARYIAEAHASQEDDLEQQEQEKQERYDEIVQYVESLSFEELRLALINALLDEEECDYDFE